MENVKLVYFSPTGTSKSVVHAIARGITPATTDSIDITRPEARATPLRLSKNELLVIAVPVYMGRIPAVVHEWLTAIRADDTPTVCVVVYGNRAYEDALLELQDIVTRCGCIPVACAAFIGEHSFSAPEAPVAEGRPDAEDLRHAEAFGKMIAEKIRQGGGTSPYPAIPVPGEHPYRRDSKLWNVDFIAVDDQCLQCGTCAKACPVGAIDSLDSALIDQDLCITCCACIKLCPQTARSMKPGPVKDAQTRLYTLFRERSMPEYFL
jgi:ferredoxin/flavodoxin